MENCRAGVRQLAALFIVFKADPVAGVRGFVPEQFFEILVCCEWVLEHFSILARGGVMCFKLQIHSRWTMKTLFSSKSSESEESLRRSDSED